MFGVFQCYLLPYILRRIFRSMPGDSDGQISVYCRTHPELLELTQFGGYKIILVELAHSP